MESGTHISSIRDFFMRSEKETIPPDLERALTLLQLQSLDDLEQRFLSADAFLEPWAVFRDSILVMQSDARPRTTEIFRTEESSAGAHIGIKRLDILWFYTQYDEGTLRYDPRADKGTLEYTSDSSVYGVIDKSEWGVEEYEKHLYAWLLQVFKVGKARNPLGFEYFELKNVCTVWEDVFVPVVNAVRVSYSVKGRRHYGRLALFIEAKRPSRLAFPEGNVTLPEGSIMSPTPFRVISVPKKRVSSGSATFVQQVAGTAGLTRKQYDETERELRDVYPQYGGLVERPRFKQKVDDWLAEQRARATLRKTVGRHGEVQSFHPKVTKCDNDQSSTKEAMEYFNSRHEHIRRQSCRNSSGSPTKRCVDNARRSVSLNASGPASIPRSDQSYLEAIRPKSPSLPPKNYLQSVKGESHFPDSHEEYQPPSLPGDREFHQLSTSLSLVHPLSRPNLQRETSEQSVYTSIRNSNPFVEDFPQELKGLHSRAATNDSVFSPMGPLSAIPKPLYKPNSIKPKKSFHESRVPSYEGTGYVEEISLTNLHASRMNVARAPDRLPASIAPVPYDGHLRVASTESYHNEAPKPVAWPGHSPPRRVAWPGFESAENLVLSPPPIPSKSPERWKSIHGHVTGACPEQILHENSQGMMRIVSKENIRAAFSNPSCESLLQNSVSRKTTGESERAESPRSKTNVLQPYNSHMFPRKEDCKGTLVDEWS